MNTQTIISVLPLGPAAYVSLACGALTLLLATLLCRSFGLFRRFRRPGSRVLCVLASALVLNAGAITARSKGASNIRSTALATPRLVHFADEPVDGTVAEIEEIIKTSSRRPAEAFASRTTVESLLADESLFESVFSTDPPCVYIEGGTHDAGDLAPLFEKYGERIEAWVRDGGRLLVNASPSSGSSPLPFGAALAGGEGATSLSPSATLYSQFFMSPEPIEGGTAIATESPSLVPPALACGHVEIPETDSWVHSPDYPYHVDLEIANLGDGDGFFLGDGICMVAPTNCLGTAMYSTLLGPSHFHMAPNLEGGAAEVVSTNGLPLWERLLYWSFHDDGLVSTPPEPDSNGTLPVSGRLFTAAGTVSTNSADLYIYNDSDRWLRTVATAECDWLCIASPTNFSWAGCREPSENNNILHVTLSDAARDLPQGVYTGSVVVANTRDFDPDPLSWTSPPAPLTTPPQYSFPSAQRHWFILTVGDPPPYAGTFRIADGGGLVTEAEGAVARFIVVRESADLPAATVRLRTEDDAARAGTDYTAKWLTLDFPEGVATNVVEIPILDNASLHTYSPATVAPRSFFVRLYSSSEGAQIDDAHAAGTVFIADDELVPHAWFVRPAAGGWDDADTDALRTLFRSGGSQPALDAFAEATFESADPAALFGPASDCVFLAFGPSEAEYIDRILSPWRDRIEAWVRAGGRLLLNAMPAQGACELPFGLAVDGDSDIGGMWYYIYDALPMTPTPIMGPGDQCVVNPAQGVPNVASASIHLYNENAPKTEDGDDHIARLSDGGFALSGHTDWYYTQLGWSEGGGIIYHSFNGPYIVVSEGAGSITCVSYRPPSQLSTSVASPTIFWQRMLLWAFRPDGFGLVATEDWRPEGVAGEPDSIAPRSKTYAVLNLGASAVNAAVSTDVDWLVAESDTAAVPAGHQTSVRISLAPEALSLPAGSYTGTVSFASSRDFCHRVDVGGWGTLTYPPPEFRRTVVLTIRSGDDPDPGPGPGPGPTPPDPATLPEEPLPSITTYGNDADASSITVTWTGGEGAASFNLYRSVTKTRPDTPLRENVTSPFIDDDPTVAPGIRYYYWVEAVNETGSVFGKPDWGNRAVALSFGTSSASVSCAAGTREIAVSANTTWTATCDAPWVTLGAATGDGDGALVVAFAANPDTGARSARIVVTAGGDTPYPRTAAFTLAQAGTPTFTVAFAPNGGTGKMAAQKVVCGKATALSANAFTRKGYVFLGWAKSKSGAVAYKNKASVKNLAPSGGKATLYAKWAKTSYKVAFYANAKNAKGKMAAQKMTYGKAKRLSANKFKRAGYVFKGWAKSKALAKKGKVAYKNKQSVKNLVTDGKTVKLYAVWKRR